MHDVVMVDGLQELALVLQEFRAPFAIGVVLIVQHVGIGLGSLLKIVSLIGYPPCTDQLVVSLAR